MNKKIVLIAVVLVLIVSSFLTETVFAGRKTSGAIYAISSVWDWRKGNSHNFQVGWEVGFQASGFTPGTYTPHIYRKVAGEQNELWFTGAPVYIYNSKGFNHYLDYFVQPGDVGYSFVVEVGGKTDVYQAVASP